MSRKQEIFNMKEFVDHRTAAFFLRKIADKIERKQIAVRMGNNVDHVKLADQLEFEVTVSSKNLDIDEKQKIKIEIKWNPDQVTFGQDIG